jgi:hypothetical protein
MYSSVRVLFSDASDGVWLNWCNQNRMRRFMGVTVEHFLMRNIVIVFSWEASPKVSRLTQMLMIPPGTRQTTSLALVKSKLLVVT